ncbi:Golgi transport complex subunit 5-domain-containing protein [Rhodocollybia butyracea]|uniref:Conserved oligomeric Golgi complex subunit 5 n=1 Tax=Rhodocollybia butyracea TaxID=206335 RepID=A0A9P5UAG5_9AGAR|nr:Golgi transport complex subunit 5-domain-containing protein [Rhodocollybia butyracea]
MVQADYSLFASAAFDANEYANAILAGEPYLPNKQSNKLSPEASAKDDISLAISKLSLGIEDVSKQIKTLVSTHHEDLLSQAANANQLAGSLTIVKNDLTDLDSSVEKLRRKISFPYQSLNTSLSRLQKFQQASDVLRRTSRFVVLARRLEGQMAEMDAAEPGSAQKLSEHVAQLSSSTSTPTTGILGDAGDEKERTIAKAALSIAELVALIDGPGTLDPIPDSPHTDSLAKSSLYGHNFNLRSIHTIASHIPFIEDARQKVTSEMENMVVTGLTTLNQSLLASSLQTAYNLGVLPQQVQTLMTELAQDVEDRIRRAFDLTKISKDANKDGNASPNPGASQYKSRVRTEPTNVTAPQWTAALWVRLENMTEEMADCCIKVYTLEKVLRLKRDTVSQTVFLDEAMTVLENKPSATFWTALSRALEKHSRDSARGSSFIQQTLSTGYPKLLRLFHEFFAKIAVHTDTVYSSTYQSPETILILRSLAHFETLYLARSTNKLSECVAQTFPSSGARVVPSVNDGLNIARTVTNELDSARFDPLFVRSVAKNVISSLETLESRTDTLIVKDRSAVLLSGPTATPAQTMNAAVATCLYHCHSRLIKLREEHNDTFLQVLYPSIQKIRLAYERIVDPMLTAIRRELGAIIARLHRIDFGKSVDRSAGMGGPSFYMKDLVDKLSFIKTEVLSKYSVEGDSHKWVMLIVKFVLRTFVLHVSIAQPLSESGKLQLTTDMTELEFALSAFMVDGSQSKKSGGNLESLGDEYRLLRAMRPLLFLENGQLANPVYTAGVPPLIVLHHILVRSPLPLPHSLHGWQEAEYVRWVDEHSDEEARTLVEGGLTHWEKTETEGKDSRGAEEYILLARTVMENAS